MVTINEILFDMDIQLIMEQIFKVHMWYDANLR